ncbi:MAG: aldo/keto reductase [Allosphingosinicella sp.]|uniref:aldo/keto reductase n=1 Tax=Allosphingosinicella sp. TaxID=2823234 RepID=UPI003949FA0A
MLNPYLLGRSGLRVTRLSLGSMTFGMADWGCDEEEAGAMLDLYLEAGGNFIDTADIYAEGASEEMLGRLIAERGVRDRLVIASKCGLAQGHANAGGNGRKAMMAALDGSLRRLATDYLDLYYLHVWDGITPAEEVLRAMDDAVSAGKIRHVALSNATGWYAAHAATLAQARGFARPCAVQLEYSLVERGIELEFPSLCRELGMGIIAWSPLCNGLLSGKHQPSEIAEGRIQAVGKRFDRLTERNWQIVAELERVAAAIGRSMAEVAVNWVANRPWVGSVILGATRADQLRQTLGALDFTLPDEALTALDEATALPPIFPYRFLATAQPRALAGARDKWPGYHGRNA